MPPKRSAEEAAKNAAAKKQRRHTHSTSAAAQPGDDDEEMPAAPEAAAGSGKGKGAAASSSKAAAASSSKAAATASSTKAAAAASISDEDEASCERCGLREAADDDLVLCDHDDGSCSHALHVTCFTHVTGVKFPQSKKQQEKFRNFCSEHATEGPAREYAHLVHNLPPRTTSAMQAEFEQHGQIYLPSPRWQEGRNANATWHAVNIALSQLKDAGAGLYAGNDFAEGDLVGYLWGMYRSSDWFHQGKRSMVLHPPVWPASQHSEEDFSSSAWTGCFRSLAVRSLPALKQVGMHMPAGSAGNHTVLVVSMQCPLGWANSPSLGSSRGANTVLKVDPAEGPHSYKKYAVYTTAAVKGGDEFLLDYGWSKQD